MTNWIVEKFSGSGGIRTHDLRVTSPLLYQLRYRALGAVLEWIPIYIPIQLVIISVGYHHWCCPEDGSNIESKHWFHPGEIVSLHDVTGITRAM